MASPGAVAKTRIATLFVETLCYGLYLGTCYHCAGTLLRIDRRLRRLDELKWVTLIPALLLFILATIHLSLQLYNVLLAFVDSGPGGMERVFLDIGDWIDVTISVLLVVQCAIGDLVLIYRCYIVYDHSWRAIIPSCVLFLGSMYCTIYFIYLEVTMSVNLLVIKLLVPYSTAFWALTTAQNCVTTGMLIYRIGTVNRRVSIHSRSGSNSSGTLQSVMRIIAESGCMYTVLAFAIFISAVLGSLAGYFLTAMQMIVIGISFNLIVTRTSKVSRPDGSDIPLSAPQTIVMGSGATSVVFTHSAHFSGPPTPKTAHFSSPPTPKSAHFSMSKPPAQTRRTSSVPSSPVTTDSKSEYELTGVVTAV